MSAQQRSTSVSAPTLIAIVQQWQHRVGNQGLADLAGVIADWQRIPGTSSVFWRSDSLAAQPIAGSTGAASPPPATDRLTPAEEALIEIDPPSRSPHEPVIDAPQPAARTVGIPALGTPTAPRAVGVPDHTPSPRLTPAEEALIEIDPPAHVDHPEPARRRAPGGRRERAGRGRAADDVTKPGFVERNASARAARPATPRRGGSAEPPSGRAPSRKGARRMPAKPVKPSLGDPALDRWTAAVQGGTRALTAGKPDDGSADASAVAAKGTSVTSARAATQADPTIDAKAHQPAIPAEPPKQRRLDTDEAVAIIAAVARAGERHLPEQALSPVAALPPYTGGPLLRSDFVPKNLTSKVAELEAQLGAELADEKLRPGLTKQLDALKQRIASIEENAGAPVPVDVPKILSADTPATLQPPNAMMGDVLGDALATAMRSIKPTVEQVVKGAVAALHGDGIEAMTQLAATYSGGFLQQELQRELEGIGAAAGISKEQLQTKVAQQQEAEARAATQAQAAIHEAGNTAVAKRTELASQETDATTRAKQAVGAEIAEKQAAASGPPDTAEIEATRDELLGKLRRTGGASLAALQASLVKRHTDLEQAAAEKKAKIRDLANTQAAAIRRHWADQPDKAMVEARPTVDWGLTEGQRVDVELKRLKQEAAASHDSSAAGVTDQLQPGMDHINDWAAHQVGRERTFWERIMDMISGWSKQAVATNEAWQQQRNAESREAMTNDLQILVELKQAKLDQNHEHYAAALDKLGTDQRELAEKYFMTGQMDAIGFVAESTLMRIATRRTPEVATSMENEAVANWTWEQLGQLARATHPGFQPLVLANKVHSAVDRWGTDEDKVYEGLGGARTAIERAALSRCYEETFGRSMYDAVDKDMSGKEWHRAKALMEGNYAMADAATIAEAVAGLGTDEKAIRDALRGKSVEELDAIKAAYREKYGVELIADLKDDMKGAELDNALALAGGDTDSADAAELEDAMAGPGTEEEKMRQVYARIREEEQGYALAHGLTKVELDLRIRNRNKRVDQRYTEMGYGNLRVNAEDELSDGNALKVDNGDNRIFRAMMDGDESKIDAAKAVDAREGLYTSDRDVEQIVRNQRKKAEFEFNLEQAAARTRLVALGQSGDISKEEFDTAAAAMDMSKKENRDRREAQIQAEGKANVAALKSDYAAMARTGLNARPDETFDTLVAEGTGGYSQQKIELLVQSGGKLSDDREIYFAIRGAGTDEDRIKETLKDKTKAEVDEIRVRYERTHGKGSFDDDILGDLSGREDLDVGLSLKYGDPSTFARQLADAPAADRPRLLAGFQDYLDTRRNFESSDLERAAGPTEDDMNTLAQLRQAVQRAREFDAALTAAEKDPKGDHKEAVAAAEAAFDMNFAGAIQAQDELRERKDAIADIAAQVAGAVAGLAVVFLSGGTLAGPVLALYASIAASATSIVIKAGLKGNAYGWEDIGIDLSVAVVDAAMSYATAGLGPKMTTMVGRAIATKGAKLAAEKAGEKMTKNALRAFVTETIEEGIENGVQAMPSAYLNAVLNGADGLEAFDAVGEAGVESAKFGMGIHSAKVVGGSLLKIGRRAIFGQGGPERFGPTASDAGRTMSPKEIAKKYGIPDDDVVKIKQISVKHGVIVDMAPTSPSAARLRRTGRALPRPAQIQLRPIDRLDVMLGLGTKKNLGKVGFFSPDQIAIPRDFAKLDPRLQDQLRRRVAQRIVEYHEHLGTINGMAEAGLIRVEGDGTLVNTGLVGDKELPFTADHQVFDMRQLDGRALEPQKYHEVMGDLLGGETGITRHPVTSEQIDSKDTLRKRAYDEVEARHSEGGDSPVLRLDGRDARAVWHQPYETSEGTVFSAEGAAAKDETVNREHFRKLMAIEPEAEFGLLFNEVTGDYMIMQGNGFFVPTGTFADVMARGGRWVLVAHSHPVHSLSKVTIPVNRVPSGGDFELAGGEVARTGRAFSSEVHFVNDQHEIGVTRFGIDPMDPEPYFIETDRPGAEPFRKRFENIHQYHEFVATTFQGVTHPIPPHVLLLEEAMSFRRAGRPHPFWAHLEPTVAVPPSGPIADHARAEPGMAAVDPPKPPRHAPDDEPVGWHPVVDPDHGAPERAIDSSEEPTARHRVIDPNRAEQAAPPVEPKLPAPDAATRPLPADAGRPLDAKDLAERYGHPQESIDKVALVATRNKVLIDLEPMDPHALAMLRAGTALELPAEIKIDPINDTDVRLGLATAADLGKVKRVAVERTRYPDDFDRLDPAEQHELRMRVRQRTAEAFNSVPAIDELAAAGKIRVEHDGTIVNTGLVKGGELPFTGDRKVFDIRHRDGRALDKATYDKVMKELVDSKAGVNHGSVSHALFDETQERFDPQIVEAKRSRFDQGGKEPLARIGDGDGPKGVWLEPYEIPAGSLLFTEGPGGLDYEGNYDYFTKTVKDLPHEECALLYNVDTGRYLLMQGDAGSVPIGDAAEMAGGGGNWVVLAHNHPIEPGLKYTAHYNRFPSGAKADMGVITKEALRRKQLFTSEIHFTMENGEPGIAKFGMDPDNVKEPYFVDVPAVHGAGTFERFTDIDHYHRWMKTTFDVEMGDIPTDFPGPRGRPPASPAEEPTANHRRVPAAFERTAPGPVVEPDGGVIRTPRVGDDGPVHTQIELEEDTIIEPVVEPVIEPVVGTGEDTTVDVHPSRDDTVVEPRPVPEESRPVRESKVLDARPAPERATARPAVEADSFDDGPTRVYTPGPDRLAELRPKAADVGAELDYQAMAQRYGIPVRHAAKILAIAKKFGVVIDFVPASIHAEAMLRKGTALARPAGITLRPLDELDMLLGIATAENLGKIAFVHQSKVKLPADFDRLDPALKQRLLARGLERRGEYIDNRDAILGLVTAGEVRIGKDGVLLNSGLVGTKELPFTADLEVFDIRTVENRAVDQETNSNVIHALHEADVGVTRGTIANQGAEAPTGHNRALLRQRLDEHTEDGGTPLARIGEARPRATWNEPYATPEGSVFSARGAAARDENFNRAQFRHLMSVEPTAEFALLYEETSGTYMLMQGDKGGVPIGLANVMAKGGSWVLIAHSHPIDPKLGHTPMLGRLPSGAKADMGAVTNHVLRTGKAFSTEIHFTNPDGTIGVTKFGMDPHDRMPYFVEEAVPGGEPISKRFENIDRYHEWVIERHPRAQLGEISNTFRGPRDETKVREPDLTPRAKQKARPANPTLKIPTTEEPEEIVIPTADEPGAEAPIPPEPDPSRGPSEQGRDRFGQIGEVIDLSEVPDRWHLPRQQVEAIRAIAQQHGVRIDMRASTPRVEQLLRERAALARPEEIRLRPIDELDVMLGMGRRAYLGRIVFVDPSTIALPQGIDHLDPDLQRRLRGRAEIRRAELARNKPAIEALCARRQIRLDSDGTIFNTGLVGARELPFTMDHEVFDIRTLDGEALDPDAYNLVIRDLIVADTGVTGGYIDQQEPGVRPRRTDRFDRMVAGHTQPEWSRHLRLGGDAAEVSGHAPYALPQHTVIHSEGPAATDVPANRQYFRALVDAYPTVEFALMRNVETGEYFVIKGSAAEVDDRLATLLAVDTMTPGGRFALEAHSHTIDRRLGYVAEGGRLPSGGAADFYAIALQSLRTGESYNSEIHYRGPNDSHEVTYFGIDPHDPEPYYVDFLRDDGSRESRRFGSIEAYHQWYLGRYGLDIGPVHPDFPRTPVEEAEIAAVAAAAPALPAHPRTEQADGAGPDDDVTIRSPRNRDGPATRPDTRPLRTAEGGPTDDAQEQAERRRRRLLAIPEADVLTADRLSARDPLGDKKDTSEFELGVRAAKDAFARLPAPASLGRPGHDPNPYEDTHAQRQAAANHWRVPLAAQRILCRECWHWFREFAEEEESTQFVADPSGVHVFGADGSYWLELHPFGPRP